MKIKFEIEITAGKCDGKSVVAVKDRLVEVRAWGAEVPMSSGYAYGSNAAYDRVADKIRAAYDALCAEVQSGGGTADWADEHTLVLRGISVEDAAVKTFANALGQSPCVRVNIN